MKPSLLLIILLFLSALMNAQSPSWLWADAYQEPKGGYCNNLCTDANNNVYVTGGFFDSVLIIGNDTLINAYSNGSGSNMFLAKYNSAGNVMWARAAAGPNANAGQSVCADANGNVYLTGYFYAAFIIIGVDSIFNPNIEGFYIAKYDSSGNMIWAQGAGGYSKGFAARANSIVTDAGGDIYLAGYFQSDYIIFGGDTLTSILSSVGNGFITKYTASGNVSWAKRIGDTTEDNEVSAITTDAGGNVYVTGGFYNPTLTLDTIVLSNTGNENIFTAKFDSSGNVIWARRAGGALTDFGNGITLDGAGNIYAAGNFSSRDIPFGRDTVINAASIGNYNVILIKYNPSGGLSWVNTSEGNNYQSNDGISADANGHIYLAGNYTSTRLDFVGYSLTNKDTTGSTTDIYLVQFDTSGNVGWAISAGGTGSDEAYGLGADAKGNLLIAGEFSSPTMVLGNDTLTDTASENNVADIFLAKYGVADTTGIQYLAPGTQHLIVFPNPSSGQFYFKGITSGSTLEVYDVLGQNIYSAIISPSGGGKGEENYLLNISSQPKGVYFYRVTTDGNSAQNGKIVVE